jgi:hypothetical protein
MTVGLLATGLSSMYFLYLGYLQEGDRAGAVPRRDRDYLIMPTLAPGGLGAELVLRY